MRSSLSPQRACACSATRGPPPERLLDEVQSILPPKQLSRHPRSRHDERGRAKNSGSNRLVGPAAQVVLDGRLLSPPDELGPVESCAIKRLTHHRRLRDIPCIHPVGSE